MGVSTWAIVGPTGTGKTELSMAAAAMLDAEIVNCDSRQIYRGLDIGSAKPSLELREQVPHHLFDVADPDEVFDCARYRDMARSAIAAIHARGRAALLVGGTGLYLKALRFGLFPGPPRDDGLRSTLETRETESPGVLHRELAEVDPPAAERIHPNDRVRVVRALEVYRLTGRPLSSWQSEHAFRGDELEMRVVGLEMPRERLYRRIDARCRAMMEGGLIEEVTGLLAAGYGADTPSLSSIGYRETMAYLQGTFGFDEAVARMARATRRFAKRQSTWFRADSSVRWIDAESADARDLLDG